MAPRAARPASPLRGSGDFHAWGDSNLYLRRQKDAIVLTIEHRAAPAPDPLRLQLGSGDDAHLAILDASVETHPRGDDEGDLDRLVLAKLAQADGPLTRAQLRAQLRVRNERLGDAMLRLAASGAVLREGDRWTVPVPTP